MKKILLVPLLAVAACNGVGHASATWTIAFSDDQGTAIPCVTENGAHEEVVLTIGSHAFTYSCTDGDGATVVTPAIPWGTYSNVTAVLNYVDASGARTQEDSLGLPAVEIDAGATTDLPVIPFLVARPVPATGSIVLDYELLNPNTQQTPSRVCDTQETLEVTLDAATHFTINCVTTASPVEIDNVPVGTYPNATVALFEAGSQELGPGEDPSSPSFNTGNTQPIILTFSLTITGGNTTTVDATHMYVSACSVNGTCR